MGLFSSMDISVSALTTQRLRMDVITNNIANSDTTMTSTGEAYRRQVVTIGEGSTRFSSVLNKQISLNGVKIESIVEDDAPFIMVYDPNHPHADEQGYVAMPNIDTLQEMTDMMSATRSYEANITALSAIKSMMRKGLEIGR